ncbi:hypothetical protein FCIRC_13585 [Fusarium circinatum]|uniref:Uncharacterized protein n=1 Tax=Fusarium circinatum TaxID=48490 RepID=A0A8H5SPB7_FUSCI|nr:hypothetical protein FCIRC_13585 [Fusarium circinatum]
MLVGFPSPDAVVQLAQKWNLRPESFIGHIFGNESDPRGFYSEPTLPSRQGNVVRVHFSSLVKSLVSGPSPKLFMKKRAAVEEACRKYEKRLFTEDKFGVTRFRGVSQHDTYCCSIEQAVSFMVVPNKRTRVGRTAVGTVPIVPYNKPITAESCDWNIGISENSITFSQLHPARNSVVHDEADMELLSEDPFFLLTSLFTTYALSFMQLLNYLSVSINEDHSMEVDLLDIKLERLRNCVRIKHRVEAALAENLQSTAQGGCSTWPRAGPGMSAAIRKQVVQSQL